MFPLVLHHGARICISLVVQGLRLCTSSAGGTGSLVRELRSHMPHSVGVGEICIFGSWNLRPFPFVCVHPDLWTPATAWGCSPNWWDASSFPVLFPVPKEGSAHQLWSPREREVRMGADDGVKESLRLKRTNMVARGQE